MVSTRQSSNMGSSSSSSSGGSVSEVVETNSLKKHQPSASTSSTSNGRSIEVRNVNLLDLPLEILQKICNYLDYNTVAHMRLVSQV